MEFYCTNCDAEATHFVDHPEPLVFRTPLCSSCKDVYEWGQASPDASIRPISEIDEEE